MKRNMELARKILELVAECQDPAGVTSADLLKSMVGAQNPAQAALQDTERYLDITYHLEMLTTAGFLMWHGRDPRSENLEDSAKPTFYYVTWAGHDLLDSFIEPQRI